MLRYRTGTIAKIIFILALLTLSYGYYMTRTAPSNFPVDKNFIVEEGETLRSISTRLEEEDYIHSALLFRAWASLQGSDRHVQLGEYTFKEPHVLGYMLKKFITLGPDMPLISVTIPEGSTSYEIAFLIHKALPTIDMDIFGEKISAKKADGKLFPSTYFLLPSASEEHIIGVMLSTFEKKYNVAFGSTAIKSPLVTRDDVINLAALLEGEAKTKEDMELVSGILLKRLSIGMALQVDVAKETYTMRGLPLYPINNPGLVALHAALHPVTSSYLYYITGKDGTMHYAKTFNEHKENIRKYLK